MNIDNLTEERERITEVELLLEDLKPIMEATCENYLEKRIPINFTINSDGSYTDMKSIYVDISKSEALNMADEEITRVVRFKVGHECQHVMSTTTDFDDLYYEMQKKWSDKAKDKGVYLDVDKLKYCLDYINAIEDGRIESIMCTDFPGLIKHRNWYRMIEWEAVEITSQYPIMCVILAELHTLACMGIHAKGYKKLQLGKDIEELINKSIPLLAKAVSSITCKECMNVCRVIGNMITDYVIEFCETSNPQNMPEELKKSFDNMNMQNIGKNLNQKEKRGKGIIVGILTDNPPEQGEETSEKPDIIIDLRENKADTDETETKDDAKNKKSENENSENDNSKGDKSEGKKEDSTGDSEGDSNNNSESKSSQEKQESNSKKSPNGGKNNDSQDNDARNSSGVQNEKSQPEDLQAAQDDVKGLTPDTAENTLQESRELTDEMLEKIIQQSIKKVEEDTKTEIESTVNSAKAKAQTKNEDATKPLSEKKIKELNNKFSSRGYKEVNVSSGKSGSRRTSNVPTDLLNKGILLKSNIQNIIASRSENDREEVFEGDLDVNSLSRLCLGQYDVFTSEGEPYEPDMCCYILKDNSGSMFGEKEELCCRSLAILEEAIKELIPLKIAAFSDKGMVIHNLIKDWDDKETASYVWDYHNSYGCGGGNNDAYSIAIATEELLARSENNKLLIVISDGMPCCSHAEVQVAVRQAREKGIFVISLFIGDANFQQAYESSYELMYEKYYVGTNPDLVSSQIYRFLEIFLETT